MNIISLETEYKNAGLLDSSKTEWVGSFKSFVDAKMKELEREEDIEVLGLKVIGDTHAEIDYRRISTNRHKRVYHLVYEKLNMPKR